MREYNVLWLSRRLVSLYETSSFPRSRKGERNPVPIKLWNPPSSDRYKNEGGLIDYFVLDLAAGVPRRNFPSGEGRQVVTRVVEMVQDDPELRTLRLSGLQEFAVARNMCSDVGTDSFLADLRSFQQCREELGWR